MKRAFSLLEALILLAIIAALAAVLFPVFARVREVNPRPICPSNLKQIGLGAMLYTQDYEGKHPPVHVMPSVGWADSLFAYIKSDEILQCDKGGNGAVAARTTDYFYNGQLAGVAVSKVKEPANTVAFGDGDDNAPMWNSWTRLPSDALTNSFLPPQRHRYGANYCFVDGHVKWLKPQEVTVSYKWGAGGR